MISLPLRVYADTCVFGGAFDPEFALASRRFFEQARDGRIQLIVSAIVVLELEDAPRRVAELFNSLQNNFRVINASEEVFLLQRKYLEAGILTPKWEDDALHVALATVSRCDLIVSWNFKHLVNLRKIQRYNIVNHQNGYLPIDIRTPEEVLADDEE